MDTWEGSGNSQEGYMRYKKSVSRYNKKSQKLHGVSDGMNFYTFPPFVEFQL